MAQAVSRIGLLVNLEKPRGLPLVARLLAWLRAQGVEALVSPEVSAALGGGVRSASVGQMAGADFLMVLGGDGTLLGAARRTAHLGLPLLGVNLGRLGFLTELEEGDLATALPGLLAGEYVLDERMMLQCAVHGPLGPGECYLALNDVVVAKGPFARLLRLTVSSGDNTIVTYPGDGIIVATPTGSTAYSLSAGGPVLHPQVSGFVVTPICPHTFYSRPLLVSPVEGLRLRPEVAPGPRHLVDVALTVDAQEGRPLVAGEWVEVRVADVRAKLVRRPGWDFYQVLRRKLAEDGRVAADGDRDES